VNEEKRKIERKKDRGEREGGMAAPIKK